MPILAKRKPEKTGFEARLRTLREQKGLTQEQLAEKTGMAYQAIARIERGDSDNPTWKTVQKFAEALGVEPNDFLDDEKEDPPPKSKNGGKK